VNVARWEGGSLEKRHEFAVVSNPGQNFQQREPQRPVEEGSVLKVTREAGMAEYPSKRAFPQRRGAVCVQTNVRRTQPRGAKCCA